MIATLNGQIVLSLILSIPAQGVPWADVETSSDVALSGSVVLTVDGVPYQMTIPAGSGGIYAGRGRYRMAAGKARWGAEIPGQDYANDMGVKASLVATDAARLCGELIDCAGIADLRLGPHIVREAGMASESLPKPWFVDSYGVTRFGPRPAGEVVLTGSELQEFDVSFGVVDVAPAEKVSRFQPGFTYQGRTISDVQIVLQNETLRVRLFASGGTEDPAIEAFRRLVEACDPLRRFRASYEYRVVSYAGKRMNLQIVRNASRMPDLQRVPVRAGISGADQEVPLGSLVVVSFIDGDKTRPAVTSFDDPDSPGSIPLRLSLVGEDDLAIEAPLPVGRVLRYGDVVCMPDALGKPIPYQLIPFSLTPSLPMPPAVYISASRVRA